jgi:hypothetical protein
MMVSTVTRAPCRQTKKRQGLESCRQVAIAEGVVAYRLQETDVEERDLDQLGRGGGGQDREDGGGASKEHDGKNLKVEEIGRAWERIEGVRTVCWKGMCVWSEDWVERERARATASGWWRRKREAIPSPRGRAAASTDEAPRFARRSSLQGSKEASKHQVMPGRSSLKAEQGARWSG